MAPPWGRKTACIIYLTAVYPCSPYRKLHTLLERPPRPPYLMDRRLPPAHAQIRGMAAGLHGFTPPHPLKPILKWRATSLEVEKWAELFTRPCRAAHRQKSRDHDTSSCRFSTRDFLRLKQRISVAVQRGNLVSVRGSSREVSVEDSFLY